ncbi:MAG: hypothetical protein HY286_07940 [Planctomycetes bacterium]|nr:hypothetical protein [Planctomycetota bacterium]
MKFTLTHKVILASAILAAVAMGAARVCLFTDPQTVYDTHSYTFDGDLNSLSAQDLGNLAFNQMMGLSQPTGITLAEDKGHVEAVLTGRVNAVGEKQLIVTVTDDTADIDHVDLYLNTTLLFRATRTNGAIIDRLGFGIATMTVYVPASLPYSLDVRWVSNSNFENKETISMN